MSDWGRPRFVPGGGDALVWFIVFGPRLKQLALSPTEYRIRGVPPGVEVANHDLAEHAHIGRDFLSGPFGRFLDEQLPALAPHVRSAPSCTYLRGTVADPPSLDYLRDSVGIATALLDQGLALLDVQALRWWARPAWREEIFDRDEPAPQKHVAVLESPEPDGTLWLHTRGLRKFGRPDLTARHVPSTLKDGMVELFERFIELQALGGTIAEGAAIRMGALPAGLTCHHGGFLDDPDFNNVHVEMRW